MTSPLHQTAPARRRLAAIGAAAALATSAVLATPLGAATGAAQTMTQPVAQQVDRTSAEPLAGSVLVVSVDGFNPSALSKLGPTGAPTFHRLIAEGATTMNARTQVELTLTLPNHTGMVTGRRVNASAGGHGVTWNDDRKRPATVQAAAGHPVGSVFTVVNGAGGSSALFASKTKFSLWQRSWPLSLDRVRIQENNTKLVKALIGDLSTPRDFRMLHLSEPDVMGHEYGFMGPRYLAAVRKVDTLLGQVLAAIDANPELAAGLTLVVTADHGGLGKEHGVATRRVNYRIPFLVRGPGVPAGVDLYSLNPAYADPGRDQLSYAAARQPIRNGAVANLALDLLGLPAVPGSEHDAAQDLEVTATAPARSATG